MEYRYYLFMGQCEPNGGWHDYIDRFENLEDAKEHAIKYFLNKEKNPYEQIEWAHIVDLSKLLVICSGACSSKWINKTTNYIKWDQ